MSRRGLIIAGLSSSSGKTFITLGVLRALRRHGASVAAAKTGPDYIDPGFHAAALGTASVNLDGFAMSGGLLRHLAASQDGEVLITEGVMGLYDGGDGSAVALAQQLELPLVVVMDIRGQSETAAELAAALTSRLNETGVTLAGVILNRARSPRHGEIIRAHCDALGVKVLGVVAECPEVEMPSRHLGLVQAADLAAQSRLEAVLDQAAEATAAGIDLDDLLAHAAPLPSPPSNVTEALPPLGQRIALAHDAAFGFSYAHVIDGWRRMGAEVSLFSPLADEPPRADADVIVLPGGYPELHLSALTTATTFRQGMAAAAARGCSIYGECGGYMVLGNAIIDGNGDAVPMLGLLNLTTSFAAPKRVLGYRQLTLLPGAPFALPPSARGHEFHFTQAVEEEGERLFHARDKSGADLGAIGLKSGSVAGSYAHLIAAV
ncbi:MAG: cobyrinate a,c-diamide synthase [Alphaproteobacteria bacterium]|nr:cobyrinate a,c-diamide synthase [Alphaproteobacteria bacterium]